MQRGRSTGPQAHRPRKVWRISPDTPLGEFVDPAIPSVPSAMDGVTTDESDSTGSHRGWLMSSFELLNGVEVSEEDPSTVPAELFDELFKPVK